ncbi:MAG TPA: DUF2293 domain-containing protein [Polyangiaceae bacterium]|nr:DUF2293 domain-containing protein [Polyangiaceae bacterium]
MVEAASQDSLTLAPTADPRVFRGEDGTRYTLPEGWSHLAPGDAGLTRRVKAMGPSWTIVEEVNRKRFARGIWAPQENIAAARAALEAERSTPEYQKRRAAELERRKKAQATYAAEFEHEVRAFLRFDPSFAAVEEKLAQRVAAHATPVGSGTVARTERISIDRRAEAAVIAWLRHQTSSYDTLAIPRVRGARRKARRDIAQMSRALLDLHRRENAHTPAACPLCKTLLLDSSKP